MADGAFKRFAIYDDASSFATGYVLMGNLEDRQLVYRDTHAVSRMASLAHVFDRTSSMDAARAYARGVDEMRERQFVRAFELSEGDVARMVPLLKVGDYVRYLKDLESYDSASEGTGLVIDDSAGLGLGFEGYTGTSTPLVQIRNAYAHQMPLKQLEELHYFLMTRFKLWSLPGARVGNEIPRSKHSRKRHGRPRLHGG